MSKPKWPLPMKLYWVTTDDHAEDWFAFGRSKRQAEHYHEDYEGYLRGAAYAELILRVPPLPDIEVKHGRRHAHIEDLQALGFELMPNTDPYQRCVRYKARLFLEGWLESANRDALRGYMEKIKQRSVKSKPVRKAS